MKKKLVMFSFLAFVIFLLIGCGGSGSEDSSNTAPNNAATIRFDIDLSPLLADGSINSNISNVTFVASKNGQTEELDLSYRNFHITDTLYLTGNFGTWEFKLLVYQYGHSAPSYSGDGNFSIQDNTNTTLSYANFNWSTAVNEEIPGYSSLKHFDQVFCKQGILYTYDSTTSQISKYNINDLTFLGDTSLPKTPQSLAFNYDKSKLLIGYSVGTIYTFDLATGSMTQVASINDTVKRMIAISRDLILVQGSDLRIVNITNGMITDSYNTWYSFGDFVLNEPLATVYAMDEWVSPQDIFRIRINIATGKFITVCDSIYHGDYEMGIPIHLINNGNYVVTSGGSRFSCTAVDNTDLVFSGTLGYSCIDLINEDGKLYLIDGDYFDDSRNLVVLNDSSYFEESSMALPQGAEYMVSSVSNIVVIVNYYDNFYAKSFSKSSLTFTSPSKHGTKLGGFVRKVKK